MSKIVFIKEPDKVYDGQFSQIGEHQVRLIFTDNIPSDSVLLSGFNLVNEYNGVVQTKRPDYTYLYRKYEDNSNQIELCNDGIAWVKPEIKVSFHVNNGGTLDGETEQIVDTYEELVVPTPVADENYKFVKWNPEIPESGIIEKSTTFVAEFEYIPTEEEIAEQAKQERIAELTSKITELESELKKTDYIFVKCYESSLVGEVVEEYDFEALHSERQTLRDEINALESELSELLV